MTVFVRPLTLDHLSQFQHIEPWSVTLNEESFIGQDSLTISTAIMNFKKRRHDNYAFTACGKMFMNALRIFFVLNGILIFSTALPNLSLGFADVIFATSLARERVNDIFSVTCELEP